ncbi:MAG: hypothetical protein RL077_6453 [Verrucomicrobiota bacterium]|jgi:hypothetical protein
MKKIILLLCSIALGACALAAAETPAPAPAKRKNWTAPAQKIYAQQLSDKIMKEHPELISVTLQGNPPGAAKDVYTMFAGSFPERIGNACDPDDVDVVVKGVTILDPRWRRTNDPAKKFVILTPLREKTGENVGLLVLAYKNDGAYAKTDDQFYAMAMKLRHDIQKDIPSFAALFAPAKM